MSEKLYKVLNKDGSARMGVGKWHLPNGDEAGEWMAPIEGELIPCGNGYHLCKPSHLLGWLGPAIFEAEYRGEMREVEDKVVVREARLLRHVGAWNDKTARLFAADCAEHMLHVFETRFPNDHRPRKAIEATRAYAHGAINADAAYAYAAAADAARAAHAAAVYAAAADGAAYGKERQWQTKRLFYYLEGGE